MTIRRSVTRVWAVFKARNLEYLRDRASFGWNLVFPILIVLALAVVFSGPPTGIFSITYLGAHDARPALLDFPGVDTVDATETTRAPDRLARQQTDMVDVRMGHKNEIDLGGFDRPQVNRNGLVTPLGDSAVNEDVLAPNLHQPARAGNADLPA